MCVCYLLVQALSVALDADGGGAAHGEGQGEGGNDTSRLSATGNSFLTDSSLDSGEGAGGASQYVLFAFAFPPSLSLRFYFVM